MLLGLSKLLYSEDNLKSKNKEKKRKKYPRQPLLLLVVFLVYNFLYTGLVVSI